VSAGCECDLIGILVENALHGIAQVQGAAHRLSSGIVAGHLEGEERHVHPPFAQTSKIKRAVCQALADVNVFDEDSLKRVVVGVHSKNVRRDRLGGFDFRRSSLATSDDLHQQKRHCKQPTEGFHDDLLQSGWGCAKSAEKQVQ